MTLLDLWVTEEERLGIEHGPGGILTSLELPLDGGGAEGGAGGLYGMDGGGDGREDVISRQSMRSEASERGEEDFAIAPEAMQPAASPTSGGAGPIGRLKDALQAARDIVAFGAEGTGAAVSVRPDWRMQEAVSREDLRGRIWAVLSMVGFNELDAPAGLAVSEPDARWNTASKGAERCLMALTLAKGYDAFCCGQTWLELKDSLEEEGIVPIDPDKDILDE